MSEEKLLTKIVSELESSKEAESEGKLGLARVYARRAAGWAIQIKLNRDGINLKSPSAFEYIKFYSEQENLEPRLKKVLEFLQIRVKKDSLDEESYWPNPEVDLISEAHWLVEELLELKIN